MSPNSYNGGEFFQSAVDEIFKIYSSHAMGIIVSSSAKTITVEEAKEKFKAQHLKLVRGMNRGDILGATNYFLVAQGNYTGLCTREILNITQEVNEYRSFYVMIAAAAKDLGIIK